MNTKRTIRWSVAALGLLPFAPWAATLTAECGMTHYVRNNGTELASTTITVRNTDPVRTATIVRLTIRDGEGKVVHESGAGTPQPLPLNTDAPNNYPGGRNISQIPPGGMVYLRSNHIWGNDGLPSGAAGNEIGQSLSASVVISKDGPKKELVVNVTPRIRERAFDSFTSSYREGATRASGNDNCELSPH